MQIGFFVNDLEREYENYATTVLAAVFDVHGEPHEGGRGDEADPEEN